MFIRPMQDFKTPNLTDEFFRAFVVDNKDPDNLGRIQIRILEIHGTEQQIPDNSLPWAMQMRPSFMGGSSNLSTFSVPRVGSEVVVTHIKGDIYQPAYIFELNSSKTILDEALEDYPESYGFKDSDGNKYHVNMEKDTLRILFNGDQYLEITKNRELTIGESDTQDIGVDLNQSIGNDRDVSVGNNSTDVVFKNKSETVGENLSQNIFGNHTTTISGNRGTSVGGNFNINITGTCNITSGGTCSVTAPTIQLNGAGGGVLTQQSINPLTGTPYPDGSTTVFAGDG